MTKDQLSQLMKWLEDLAPTNPERITKLREILGKTEGVELQQLDRDSIAWLLDVVIEAERKDLKLKVVLPNPKPRLMEGFDPDDTLDGDHWGVWD